MLTNIVYLIGASLQQLAVFENLKKMVETVSSREQLTSSNFGGSVGSISVPMTFRNYSNLLKNSTLNQMFGSAPKKLEFSNSNSCNRKYLQEGSDCDVGSDQDLSSSANKSFSELKRSSPSPEPEPFFLRKSKRTMSPYPENERLAIIEACNDKALEASVLNYKKSGENSDVNRDSEVKSECSLLYTNNADMRKSQLFINNLTESSPSRPVGSSFSIDSILSRGNVSSTQSRVTSTLHPGLHLSHLAAAAASSFGTSSADFLGKIKHLFFQKSLLDSFKLNNVSPFMFLHLLRLYQEQYLKIKLFLLL